MTANETPATKNLYQRIALVMRELEALPKTGRNTQQGYRYIEQGAVMDTLRPKLGAHGIVLVPRILSSEKTSATTKNGGIMFTERAHIEFTLVNADNPADTLTVPWIAEGQDSADKAINKALVAAQKYVLMKMFLISDAEDPDRGGEEIRQGQAGPRKAAAPVRPSVSRPGPAPLAAHPTSAPAPAPTPATPATEDGGDLRRERAAAVMDLCALLARPVPASLGDWNALAKWGGVMQPRTSAEMTEGWLGLLLDKMRAKAATTLLEQLDEPGVDAAAVQDIRARGAAAYGAGHLTEVEWRQVEIVIDATEATLGVAL